MNALNDIRNFFKVNNPVNFELFNLVLLVITLSM